MVGVCDGIDGGEDFIPWCLKDSVLPVLVSASVLAESYRLQESECFCPKRTLAPTNNWEL